MKYYLGSFVPDRAWSSPVYDPPAGTLGCVELACDVREHFGFFALPDDAPAPDLTLVGDGHLASSQMTLKQRQAWTALTGKAPPAGTLLDALWGTLTVQADPLRETGVRPIIPTTRGMLELHLAGHSLVRSKRFDLASLEAVPVIAQEAAIYAEVRQRALQGEYRNKSGAIDEEWHRRYLKGLGERYRIGNPEDVFIPAGVPKETALPHETSYSESFNTADSDTVGPDLTWTEVVKDWDILSNQLLFNETIFGSPSDGWVRAEHDVSGNNNYSQIDVISSAAQGESQGYGVTCRGSSSATTFYLGWVYRNSTGNLDYPFCSKVVTGTRTNLVTGAQFTISPPDTFYMEVNGSTLDFKINGTSRASGTNTDIASGTRGGVFAASNVATKPIFDIFTFADLAASGVVFLMHSPLLGGAGNVGGLIA